MEKVLSHLCLYSDLGVSGNMYGGKLLQLMDEAAAVYAIESTGESDIVTRAFSAVEFKSPVKPGEILDFYAEDPVCGRSSFSFTIAVLVRGVRRFEARCTFVAVDPGGGRKNIDWEKAPVRRAETAPEDRTEA